MLNVVKGVEEQEEEGEGSRKRQREIKTEERSESSWRKNGDH